MSIGTKFSIDFSAPLREESAEMGISLTVRGYKTVTKTEPSQGMRDVWTESLHAGVLNGLMLE